MLDGMRTILKRTHVSAVLRIQAGTSDVVPLEMQLSHVTSAIQTAHTTNKVL